MRLAPANEDPDVINKAACDWIANYPVAFSDWSLRASPVTITLELVQTNIIKGRTNILVMPIDSD